MSALANEPKWLRVALSKPGARNCCRGPPLNLGAADHLTPTNQPNYTYGERTRAQRGFDPRAKDTWTRHLRPTRTRVAFQAACKDCNLALRPCHLLENGKTMRMIRSCRPCSSKVVPDIARTVCVGSFRSLHSRFSAQGPAGFEN